MPWNCAELHFQAGTGASIFAILNQTSCVFPCSQCFPARSHAPQRVRPVKSDPLRSTSRHHQDVVFVFLKLIHNIFIFLHFHTLQILFRKEYLKKVWSIEVKQVPKMCCELSYGIFRIHHASERKMHNFHLIEKYPIARSDSELQEDSEGFFCFSKTLTCVTVGCSNGERWSCSVGGVARRTQPRRIVCDFNALCLAVGAGMRERHGRSGCGCESGLNSESEKARNAESMGCTLSCKVFSVMDKMWIKSLSQALIVSLLPCVSKKPTDSKRLSSEHLHSQETSSSRCRPTGPSGWMPRIFRSRSTYRTAHKCIQGRLIYIFIFH